MRRDAFTEEHELYREQFKKFAAKEIAPKVVAWNREGITDRDTWKKMGEAGFLAPCMPEEYGGAGADFRYDAIIMEELAYLRAHGIMTTVHASICLPYLVTFGTEAQKRRWLPALTAGEKLGAFGLTEPGGGSDAGATRTTARLDGEEWVINGSKAFITNSGTDITALITVTALTGEKAISSIIVPAGTPGLRVAPKYSKVGWSASDTRELSFDDVRVPAENLVGERGRGYAQFLSILDEGRIAIAALATGLAQGCVDESLRYAKQRQAFGRPIGDFQAIQFKVADMEMRAHTARLAWYDAAARLVRGEDFKRQAAIAKLYGSEVAVANARDATQIHGGYGFMNEFPVARFWRDAKVLEIGEGTSEVQRMIIARDLGL